MASQTEPYIKRSPGDLWTAEDWNDVQTKIRSDIGQQITTAVKNIKSVPHAEDSDKLEGQSADELTKAILESVLQELPKRTGYRRLFKRLEPNQERIITHDLESHPLADFYQLLPFSAVCEEDEQKNKDDDTYFYLYHTSEKKIRFTPPTPPGGAPVSVENEPVDGPAFRIPFSDMLREFKIEYDDSTTLDDLETEFWTAFFGEPNDTFDDDDYCHSPWFARCCGEKRSVEQLKKRGDWDEIWFKVKPVKTVNKTNVPAEQNPINIRVNQYDLNTLGVTYMPVTTTTGAAAQRVMVLLKV
jgi:hypothetical protein